MTRYTRGAWAVTASLPARPQVVRHARRIARTALEAWGAGETSDAAETVVSELVTNALVYGRGPVDLAIALTDEMLRISVTDHGRALPRARAAGPEEQSGRGLQIVEALALSWEVLARPDGKTITCVLPAVPVGTPARPCAAAEAAGTAERR
jgi:anti-sigma regulatory factor (Ser/Thr protein kinase)